MPKKDLLEKIKTGYKDLPDKKKYAEFVSAFMSIPIMATVLITNLNNLKKEKVAAVALPTPTISIVQKNQKETDVLEKDLKKEVIADIKTSATPTTSEHLSGSRQKECKKEIGPVEVLSPLEDERIERDFVLIEIGGQREGYCDISWSYRINGGNWSEYTDKSISIYSLEPGRKKLEVKIRGVSGGEERIIERSFNYAGKNQILTPTEVPTVITLTPTSLPSTGATNTVNTN